MDLNIGITKNNEWTTHQFPVRRTRSPADHTVVCCQNNACFAVKKMKHLLSLSICIILTKKRLKLKKIPSSRQRNYCFCGYCCDEPIS